MITFRSLLLAGMLAPLSALALAPAAAEPTRLLLAQAQAQPGVVVPVAPAETRRAARDRERAARKLARDQEKAAKELAKSEKKAADDREKAAKAAAKENDAANRPGRRGERRDTTAAALAVPATDGSARRLGDIRRGRTQSQENGRTVIRESGRTIVREGGRSTIRYDETERMRASARDVSVERRGRETVTTVVRPDGSRIVTVVDDGQRLLRRSRLDSGGREVVLIDNTRARPSGARSFVHLAPPRHEIARDRYIVGAGIATAAMILETFMAPPVVQIERPYALDEIRDSVGVRDRMRRIDIDTITFDTGSWAVAPGQAAALDGIAGAMRRVIERNPAEVFLVEGHTDAVGSDIDNLSLSDRRAEAVAIVLSDRFGVPPENLATQGYGEEFLKVATSGAARENRRVAIRRITPLLSGTDRVGG